MPYHTSYPVYTKRSQLSPLDRQEGAGVGDLFRSAAKAVGISIPEPLYPGEKHAIGLSGADKGAAYAFAGPGTHIEERLAAGGKQAQPINGVDAAAKEHDIAYLKINKAVKSGALSKADAKKQIWAADKVFKQAVEKNKSDDPIVAKIAQSAISAKEVGERLGVLPIETFSLSGAGLQQEIERLSMLFRPKPGQRLKAMAEGKQSGGFAFAPLLIPLVASLAGSALNKLLEHLLSNKQKGSGFVTDMTDQEKREEILHRLSKLPQKKQIGALSVVQQSIQ